MLVAVASLVAYLPHPRLSPRLRRGNPLRCQSAGQGFGKRTDQQSSAKDRKGVDAGDAKAVERAVKLVEERKARPVDELEAARGRVEFVKVKDWGSGQPTELGQLQVEAASQVQLDADAPLYEQLAKRLELLEAQGAMAVAQPKDAKPLPPFKDWAFAEEHYLQYLSDLLSVHSALEEALRTCASTTVCGNLLPGHLRQALTRLASADHGLFRSQQLMVDIQRIAPDSGDEVGSGRRPASPNAAGLAQFLTGLATRMGAAESQGEASAAVIRLLAHAYVLQLVLLSSGTRIGAAAAEKLGLMYRGALNTYKSYPAQVKNPVEQLKGLINEWGDLLTEAEREELMQELPSAMQKASLLLTPLARE